jgi:hypothetical protein
MIDWTQPIETTETPPRRVRVLFDKDGAFAGAVYIYDDLHTVRGVRACRPGYDSIPLRNVAPPEPGPVLREAFLHLYADGGVAVTYVRTSAAPAVEVRHEKWMSDGSPVPGEDKTAEYKADRDWLSQKYQDMIAERDRWKAQCEGWAAKATEWTLERDSLKAEVERMKPVVGAAVGGVDSFNRRGLLRLIEAVRAYQNTQSATSESHEAFKDDMIELARQSREPKKTAEEAVANVAKMMGPVKSCGTCRFRTNATFDECAFVRRLTVECSLNNFSRWEAKND